MQQKCQVEIWLKNGQVEIWQKICDSQDTNWCLTQKQAKRHAKGGMQKRLTCKKRVESWGPGN
jgi:hypothetical protein